MAPDIRAQACAYLRDGRVTVLQATTDQVDPARPHQIRARVVGHSSTYIVKLTYGVWDCTCRRAAECPHAAAVQLVTGWPSLAAPRKDRKR